MKILKVRDVKTPSRGTSKSAGIDFYVPNNLPYAIRIQPHRDFLIPSGIKAAIPEGYMLMAADKSGVVTTATAVKMIGRTPKPNAFDCAVIVGAKIVDEDYQGEIHIHVINTGDDEIVIEPGTKIAQFILVPVFYDNIEEVSNESELFKSPTERGEGGFGLGTGND